MTRAAAAGTVRAAHGVHGIAVPAVLALLAAVSTLMLAYGLLATANWLAARNLREGVHAWTLGESAAALVLAELGEEYRRHGALPASYGLPPDSLEGVELVYAPLDGSRAEVEIVARVRNAVSRRVVEVDMSGA